MALNIGQVGVDGLNDLILVALIVVNLFGIDRSLHKLGFLAVLEQTSGKIVSALDRENVLRLF